MTTRTSSCRCGQLKATATGEPVRLTVCHCLDCKKASGSAFAVQARWPAEQVTIEGRSKAHVNVTDTRQSHQPSTSVPTMCTTNLGKTLADASGLSLAGRLERVSFILALTLFNLDQSCRPHLPEIRRKLVKRGDMT